MRANSSKSAHGSPSGVARHSTALEMSDVVLGPLDVSCGLVTLFPDFGENSLGAKLATLVSQTEEPSAAVVANEARDDLSERVSEGVSEGVSEALDDLQERVPSFSSHWSLLRSLSGG
mmetsp:Transcript_105883/g.210467  ORF Transcript_105883/g.210467 Transcript_105883/m.210467 type:complete len:118 (-) Transcript_105883:506-859(-)